MLPLLLWNLSIIVKRIFAIDIGHNSYPHGASQQKVVLSYHQSQVYVLIEKINRYHYTDQSNSFWRHGSKVLCLLTEIVEQC